MNDGEIAIAGRSVVDRWRVPVERRIYGEYVAVLAKITGKEESRSLLLLPVGDQ